MGLRRICMTLGVCVAAVCGAAAQQVPPRIAGLEGNEEYMSLLREDARLQVQEDSVVRAVNAARRQFREAPGGRERLAQQILASEERIFSIRNARGRLTDRIGTIEQAWVLSNLDAPAAGKTSEPVAAIPEGEKVRNLVYNRYFAQQLPAADHAALMAAQRMEMQAVDYVNRYMTNYQEIARLAELYAAAAAEEEAVELYGKYETLQGLNDVLADSLAGVWNYIFDNKTYAYGYLLDKLGQEEILAREEELFSKASQQLSESRGQYASDVLSDYFLRKPIVADYETQVASLLDLTAARDSLRGVAAQLRAVDYRLPKIEAAERYFIDYTPLSFSSPSKYNAQHPIPECRVFRQGVVYRVQIGTFSAKRPVSVFRGACPLCYQIDENGKWRYFAGGFATAAEAEDALKRLKAKGFVRPELVVWRDGVYRNLTRDPEQTAVTYRIEIEGIDTLPDAVKKAIAAAAPEHELSRVGRQFFVGPFAERIEADKAAAAIRTADNALEIKVTEIAENPK